VESGFQWDWLGSHAVQSFEDTAGALRVEGD
jgi:hypothetical protein